MISTSASIQNILYYQKLSYLHKGIKSGEMNLPLMSIKDSNNIPADAVISYKKTPIVDVQTWGSQVKDFTPYVPTGQGMSFSIDDFLSAGKEKYSKDTMHPQHYQNALSLLDKINKLGELIKYDNIISSGYRSPERQRQIYAERNEPPAMGSKHIYGHALDIYDPQGDLKQKILNRPVLEKAKELGLYFENFSKTPTWVHIQDEAPARTGGQIWSADNLLDKHNL